MASRKVGRPSKIDKDTMHSANILFIIIIIILLLLLSVVTLSFVSPEAYESLQGLIKYLFN